jgi:hypothetical protein
VRSRKTPTTPHRSAQDSRNCSSRSSLPSVRGIRAPLPTIPSSRRIAMAPKIFRLPPVVCASDRSIFAVDPSPEVVKMESKSSHAHLEALLLGLQHLRHRYWAMKMGVSREKCLRAVRVRDTCQTHSQRSSPEALIPSIKFLLSALIRHSAHGVQPLVASNLACPLLRAHTLRVIHAAQAPH